MIPEPEFGRGQAEGDVLAGASPGGTGGILLSPGERTGDSWDEGHHPPAIGPWKLAARRLRRNYVAQGFFVLLLLIVAACLLAPVYASHIAHIGPNTNNVTGTVSVGGQQVDVVNPSGVPVGPTFGSHYFFGADSNGRDLAVRLLYGGRTSLLIGGIATIIIIIFGALVGLLTGYFRGVADMILRPLMELIWSFPVVILGVALGTALALGGIGPVKGNSLYIPALIIGVVYIPYLGKPIRGEVLRLREQDFIQAARVQGMGSWRIMLSEILPNLASMITVFIPMMLAYAILLEAYLSFLGAGVQAPNASWGTLISDGLPYIQTTPTYCLIPGAMLVLTVLSINVVGEEDRRRARPPRPGEGEDLMGRFVVRRMASAILLMFATSIVVFGIFEVIPELQPGSGHRRPQRHPHHGGRGQRQVRLRQAGSRPVRQHDEADLHRPDHRLPGQPQRRPAVHPAVPGDGLPRRPGRADLASGVHRAGLDKRAARRRPGRPQLDGGSHPRRIDPGVPARRGPAVPVRVQAAVVPQYRLRPADLQSRAVGLPPVPAVDLDRGPVHRLLLPRAALQPPRHGQRGLRAHRPGQRPDPATGLPPPRAAQLAHADRHHVRAGPSPRCSAVAWRTQTVFNLPGIGQYEAQAIGNLDVPPIMVGAMFTAFFVVLFSALSDIVYALLDPRIRLTG